MQYHSIYYLFFQSHSLLKMSAVYLEKVFEDPAQDMYVNMIKCFSLQAINSYRYKAIPMLPVQIRVHRVLPCWNLLRFCIFLKTATLLQD